MARFLIFIFGFQMWSATPVWSNPAVAFHYGTEPPTDELRAFDWVVVQPYSNLNPADYQTPDSQLFVYVSAGELHGQSTHLNKIPKGCIVGTNKAWQASVIDQSLPKCRQYFLDHIVTPLWERGFRGFFLDTLDSYQLVSEQASDRKRHEQGLVALIQAIKSRYPETKLILNRGFPFLEQVASDVDAVAAESLYQGWNQSQHQYTKVNPQDRQWLLNQLNKARNLGLPVIVIDYLPPNQRDQARITAKKIQSHGFIPWITNADLNMVGIGLREVMPRKILMLYNGNTNPYDSNLNYYLTMPVNYLGYSARPLHIQNSLPDFPLTGTHAGIVTWFEKPLGAESERVWQWLVQQKNNGVPIVIMGDFGFPLDKPHLKPFGLSAPNISETGAPITITKIDKRFIGLEAAPQPTIADFSPLHLEKGKVLLQLQDSKKQRQDAAAITPWGGYIVAPHIVNLITLPEEGAQSLWILDPFTFLTQALRLPEFPVPDITTRSGRRIMMIHIDGDGFAALSTVPDYYGRFAGEVLEMEILRKYRWPTNVSYIVGEFTDDGLFPKKAPQLRKIARRILELPWTETASHTYSHPFNWQALEKNPDLSAGVNPKPVNPAAGEYGYNLPIPGYRFDPYMETAGSAKLIDELIAPPGKKTKIINWSGDTDPGVPSLKAAYQAGLLNINGGGSVILRTKPSLTNLFGNGIWKGDYFQVFAPVGNENDFTNLWQGPFYGFKRVRNTFQLTESPRRLKPINIYYHFYSADRPGALHALQEVYAWAARQQSHPLFSSAYIQSALDFEKLVIARQQNHFIIRNYGQALTLRVPQKFGYPNLNTSDHVAGFDAANGENYYFHLTPGSQARFSFTDKKHTKPYVISANATVETYTIDHDRLRIKLRGEVPIKVKLAPGDHCKRTHLSRNPIHSQKGKGFIQYHFHEQSVKFTFKCQ
ncbi:MAG: hypothetical protein AXA67_07105 [Methylothermaceae bacteria B42]|nr:MAG: hypothetical protein AXA67_07105 [Methylothermaceae bacteria B42]HHJ40207.1 hypothetical protein [Methylothermaceae bacterium]